LTDPLGFAKSTLSKGLRASILSLTPSGNFNNERTFFIRFLGFLLAIALAFWVYHDANRRGKTHGKAVAWAAGVLFLGIIFLPPLRLHLS
jgi:hypothetical protein